jgi:hypothetical protein
MHPADATEAPAPGTLQAALLTEAVRQLERDGPLEDGQALREAVAAGGPAARQIATRAAVLGRRLGLQARLQRARQWAPWVLLGLAALVVLLGLALAGRVVDADGRRINVVAALAALLGLHALTLLLWLLALLWPGGGSSAGTLAGQAWLALTARASLGRGAEGAALLRAGTGLLERARLLPWALGLASHTIWSISFVAALGALLWALAFQHYTLGWETTLLPPESFTRWIEALGAAPAGLGFPVPSAAALAAAANGPLPADANRALAWWLVGCVGVYGLLPRLLAALACGLVWQWRRGRMRPDFDLPYYRQLQARLDAQAPATAVVDPDTHGPAWHLTRASLAGETRPTLAVIGFELPPEFPWPPQPLPASASVVQRIAGSAAERQALLQTLAQTRPRALVLACNAIASPDRGTERLLRELLPLCGVCRLWLAQPTPIDAGNPDDEASQAVSPGAQRWRRWLDSLGLADIRTHTAWPPVLRWIATLPLRAEPQDRP